jgi:predicted nucleic acid-binding protein
VIRFLDDVAAGRFRVEGLTPAEHGIALELDQAYGDLRLGLADLSVLVLAHRFRTRRLLTFDERDFRAVRPIAGGAFTLLPADASQ